MTLLIQTPAPIPLRPMPPCARAAPQVGFLPERACYERQGVPPDEQYSRVPAEDEEGVTFRTFDGSRTLTWK